MKNDKTVLIRVKKGLRDTLNRRFPEVKMPELIQVMYDTSLIRFEGVLKEKEFKKKSLDFLYGKKK